jgi:hypothetical protein
MTPEESKDFADYGCAARCIIYLAHENGISLTIEDFVKKYDSLFKSDQGKKRIGLITPRLLGDHALNAATLFSAVHIG